MPRQTLDLGVNGLEFLKASCVDCLNYVVKFETDVMWGDISRVVRVV